VPIAERQLFFIHLLPVVLTMVVPGNTFERPVWHPIMTAAAWKEQFRAAKGSNFRYSISWASKLKGALPTTIEYSMGQRGQQESESSLNTPQSWNQ
jgi:hypothetical protein